jgi:murein DD-endopeptidase MepM/ murein hydrolase activator NlpD
MPIEFWTKPIIASRSIFLAVLLCGFGVNTSRGGTDSGKMVKVFTRDEGGVIHFYVQNLELATVTATFEVRLQNMKGTTHFPCTTVLPGNQTAEVFALAPIKPDVHCDYSYIRSSLIGSADAVHDDSYVYLLPYAPGASFHVSQGYHGAFSHTGPDEYAIDWQMPVGTPIHAAREGLVVESKDDMDQGGPSLKYEKSANCILIQHPDGTIGIYGHLKKDGNKVKVGDRVQAGDFIGLSGNTGYTCGPHLHFAVFKAKNGRERMSLPVKFHSADAAAITLVSGQWYQAALLAPSPIATRAPMMDDARLSALVSR